MITIHPYLNFPGNTEEAFEFYKTVFGGEFIVVQRYKDTPEKDRMPLEHQNKIMHMALPIGQGTVLMGTDAMGQMGEKLTPGNNFYLSIDAGSRDEAKAIYDNLSAGGKTPMPLADTFWGAYFGMLVDKFGINWMVTFDEKNHP